MRCSKHKACGVQVTACSDWRYEYILEIISQTSGLFRGEENTDLFPGGKIAEIAVQCAYSGAMCIRLCRRVEKTSSTDVAYPQPREENISMVR